MSPTEDEDSYEMVYPFVVCTSNGGIYDDAAFVAGCYFGQAMYKVEHREERISMTVPPALVPQLELLAMSKGYELASSLWDEAPDEWALVRLELPWAPVGEVDR